MAYLRFDTFALSWVSYQVQKKLCIVRRDEHGLRVSIRKVWWYIMAARQQCSWRSAEVDRCWDATKDGANRSMFMTYAEETGAAWVVECFLSYLLRFVCFVWSVVSSSLSPPAVALSVLLHFVVVVLAVVIVISVSAGAVQKRLSVAFTTIDWHQQSLHTAINQTMWNMYACITTCGCAFKNIHTRQVYNIYKYIYKCISHINRQYFANIQRTFTCDSYCTFK